MARAAPPVPRTGPLGLIDEFIGPGATSTEVALQIAPLPFALYFGWTGASNAGYGVGRSFAAAMLALDLVGGVATNSTGAAKRWYHREGQGLGAHLCFVAPHIAHLLLVAWLFRARDWTWAFVVAVYLLGAAILICLVDKAVQRTVALLLYAVAVWVDVVGKWGTRGLEWFIPLFFLKLFVAHLVYEVTVVEQPEATDERLPITEQRGFGNEGM